MVAKQLAKRDITALHSVWCSVKIIHSLSYNKCKKCWKSSLLR